MGHGSQQGTVVETELQKSPNPWRGVSLGGWLLLEPGPSFPLFENFDGDVVRCEWGLMEALRRKVGNEGAADVIHRHRMNHITKKDFQRIRQLGLNAVRLPFGYWVVTGPTKGEPYADVGLEFIDSALDWADECGLQVVLDLHGCPGGESGEAPCGRRQRPHGTWQWQHWDFSETLQVVEVLVRRYCRRTCVTGITVCNEPSNEVPLARLCQYYDEATSLIRSCGMPASRVTVVLPVFQRPEDRFARKWNTLTGGKHENYCFDIHCYHCFENDFNGKTMAQHMRAVEQNKVLFRTHPAVVGEWSLSLGVAAWTTCGNTREDDIYSIFGRAQLHAMQEATHGHFFWNWSERPDTPEWNYPEAVEKGYLTGAPPTCPDWNGKGEDPLEELFNPCPGGEPIVRYGERVYLRVFYGRYVDVCASEVGASWSDKGGWQEFTFRPVSGVLPSLRQPIRNGDTVQLRAHNGRMLSVGPKANSSVTVTKASEAGKETLFTIRLKEGNVLEHRGYIYLQSKATGQMLDADDEEDGLFARYSDFGEWQRFGVEKTAPKRQRIALGLTGRKIGAKDAPPTPKNRRRQVPERTEALLPIVKRMRLSCKSAP